MLDDIVDMVDAPACFAHSQAPLPGESLLGFVARNCEVHGITKVAAALRPTDLEGEVTEWLPTAHVDKVDALARLFATTPDEVVSRMYPPVRLPDGRSGGHVAFFGAPIRKDLIQFQRRRVSPSSLARSPHHRAVWDLRVFSFCQESREALISECPRCRSPLGWRWTEGVDRCERCGEDLSRTPGTPITCQDWDALDFACDLVHHDPDRRERARASVPTQLSALDAADLFEMIFELACVSLTGTDRRLYRPRFDEDYGRFTPDVLAKAGRLLLGWPSSMHAFADDLRRLSSSRPGFWGALKELAPLVVASRRTTISPAARHILQDFVRADVARDGSALRRAHRRDDDLMTVSEAYETFGFSKATLKRLRGLGLIAATFNPDADRSIVLVSRREMARMADEQRDVISRIDVAAALGIDYLAVQRLAEAGLLRAVSPPVAALLVGDHYRRSSVVALCDRLKATSGDGDEVTSDKVTLAKAAAGLTTKIVPWVGIVSAILSGALRVVRVTSPADGSVALRLGVCPAHLEGLVRELPEEVLPEYGDRRINTHEAAAILAVPAPVITYLTQGGHLPATGDAWFRLKATDVLAFHAKHVSNQEVARRSGKPGRLVVPALQALGVGVFSPDPAGKTRFWDRQKAENALNLHA